MAYTCPDCGRTSNHPEDERFEYCGYCREFKGDNRRWRAEFMARVDRALDSAEPAAALRDLVEGCERAGFARTDLLSNLSKMSVFMHMTHSPQAVAVMMRQMADMVP